ncbi:MAG: thymidine kinase [Gammaproteobacteria bacterium TMED112]|nr:MAG: thymidine kinase [Gammaproteobacteria bacterium TMED112]
MAKLHFYYSTMNAGKSTSLLQSNHNYKVRNLKTYIFTPKVDAQFHEGKIHSRLGVEEKAHVFDENFDFYEYFQIKNKENISCILVDEAQFLTELQVKELCKVCDEFNIPVMCYGIRTDFRGELFTGSMSLLAYADTMVELKTICEYENCSRKATMVARFVDGKLVTEGDKVVIGGDNYKVYCRKHYRKITGLI